MAVLEHTMIHMENSPRGNVISSCMILASDNSVLKARPGIITICAQTLLDDFDCDSEVFRAQDHGFDENDGKAIRRISQMLYSIMSEYGWNRSSVEYTQHPLWKELGALARDVVKHAGIE